MKTVEAWRTEPNTQTDYTDGVILTQERMQAFFMQQREKNRAEATIERYRKDLDRLYAWLPEDKAVTQDRLMEWKQDMLENGFSGRTVNTRISAANSFLAFEGLRELQLMDFEENEKVETVLTRQEYVRLLQAARNASDQRLYLLIKLFGTTGLPVQYLKDVTVDTLAGGVIRTEEAEDRIPVCMQDELKSYIEENHLSSGPVFRSRSGKLVNRTTVTSLMKKLSIDAQVEREKITPRCLKKMYHETQEMLENEVKPLVEKAYKQILEEEQRLAGWDL